MLDYWQGGMAGLIMRLRQDGHDELQLHGPSGRSSFTFHALVFHSSRDSPEALSEFQLGIKAQKSFLHNLSGMYAVRYVSELRHPRLFSKQFAKHGGRPFAVAIRSVLSNMVSCDSCLSGFC